MTNMPALDKNSAVQNILSAKGTKPAASSAKGNFDTVLKQTTEAGKQNADTGKKTETAKPAETKADDSASENRVDESAKTEENAKTEEKAGTEKTETKEQTEETKDVSEEPAEDMAVLEKAGSEMAAALAVQMGIPEDVVRDAMDDLGMTEVSLLDPKNVKELMIHLTEGADDMSLLTDEAFYNSVAEALETLDELREGLQEETGMSSEELNRALQTAGEQLEKAAEPAVEVAGRQELSEQEKTDTSVKFNAPKPELTENARTETVAPKDAPKQENTGKDSESPFMGNSYQTQNPEVNAEMQAAETRGTFSMAADTQEIMDQILDYMKVSVKPEMTSLEMQLHPESLGTLHIQISNREGAVTAQFIAQNESVKAVLESQVMELKENLEQQGLKVEAVEVTIAQYSLDRNPDGNETSSGQERQGKRGGRNLNLRELDPEEEENLTEEEKLTAEMMQSSGSTVNYTA